MPTGTVIERRDRAVVAFTIVTGMRDNAIASLRLKHIDLDRELVVQDPLEVRTKFSKKIITYFFPVREDLKQVVVDWVRSLREDLLYGNDDPFFPRTKIVQDENHCFNADGLEPAFWANAEPIRKIFRQAFGAAAWAISIRTPSATRWSNSAKNYAGRRRSSRRGARIWVTSRCSRPFAATAASTPRARAN